MLGAVSDWRFGIGALGKRKTRWNRDTSLMLTSRRSSTSTASKTGVARIHVEHSVQNFTTLTLSAYFPDEAPFSDEHTVVPPDEATRGLKDSMQTWDQKWATVIGTVVPRLIDKTTERDGNAYEHERKA